MDNITIPVDDIVKNKISINEYLILYNIANGFVITGILETSLQTLTGLESKGFIKMSKEGVFLRDKASIFFAMNDDLFVKWLRTYPTSVKKKFGGNRALSPADENTILGKKLRKKWEMIFKKDTQKQQIAIRVLELEVKDKTRSGDLEYMVEATRWLNEGYHEKYSYLIDQDMGENKYSNEDYL
tara:strand:+ start:20954 stop:21505 length:552 start_codon:yes stop_codon:yes gene_type:complete